MGGETPAFDMQEILPPGIFMPLEQGGIAEQAETIHHLLFDLEGAGIKGLGSGGGQSGHEHGDDDENPEHGRRFWPAIGAKLGRCFGHPYL